MSTLAGYSFARQEVTLTNWRSSPFSAWSFQNVNEIVPSAVIAGNALSEGPVVPLGALASLVVDSPKGLPISLQEFLVQSHTDNFVVMRDGAIVGEWYAQTSDRLKPHLLFSVSKSITGILTGILEDNGLLSTSDLVVRYVPEADGSAYGDATIRQLLDMEVALDFNEDYLDKTGGFDRYRRATGWNPEISGEPSSDLNTFLCSVAKTKSEHGKVHLYRSPNTDMIGIVLERASGKRIPDLISELIWKPIGAHSDAFVTVDCIGTSRVAGGISVTARDLVRFGDMVRRKGGGVVSARWIDDLWTGGSRQTWAVGDQAESFENGSYRSFWYETGHGELAAIGIHGQWIWIDPATKTVIVRQSCQELPTHDAIDSALRAMLRAVAKAV